MMDVERFLAARRPEPPPALAAWVGALGLRGPAEESLPRGGAAELCRARSRPGRVRESAFSLLAADALFTWACEAALDDPDPEEALAAILTRAAASEP